MIFEALSTVSLESLAKKVKNLVGYCSKQFTYLESQQLEIMDRQNAQKTRTDETLKVLISLAKTVELQVETIEQLKRDNAALNRTVMSLSSQLEHMI